MRVGILWFEMGNTSSCIVLGARDAPGDASRVSRTDHNTVSTVCTSTVLPCIRGC